MKRLMKVCLSLFMAVIMVVGSCSFAAPVNSTARNTYLQLEKKNIKSVENFMLKNKLFFDTNFNSAREYMEIYGENLPGDLGNLKLKAIEELDKKKNYQYAEIVLGNKDIDKISLEMILKNNVLMMQVPEIYEKFVSIDFSKAKEICEKFEIEVTDEEINQFTKMLSTAQNGSILSKEDEVYLKKVAPKYVKMLNGLVDASHFTMNNSTRIEYDGKSLDCKSVSYEVTFREIMVSLCEILKEVRNDEKLLDIFMLVMNYNGEFDIEKEEIIYGIDSFVLGIEEELKSDDFDSVKLVSTLYYNTKKETLKREIKLVDIIFDEEEAISFTTIDGKYYELDLDDIKLVDNVVKLNKKTEHNISIIEEGIDYDFDEETYEFTEIPYTKTENFKVLVETPDKKNTSITFSKDGINEKFIVNLKLNTLASKKLDCNLEFIYDTDAVDYKVFVNYLVEKDIKIIEKSFNNLEISIDRMSKEELSKEVEINQEDVTKKAEAIFRELFPETIKEAEESERRMLARYDNSTGSMIGKALRVWQTDVTTDPTLNINDRISDTWREYSTFEGIEDYIMPGQTAQLGEGKFYVCKDLYDRIVVGVSNNGGLDLPSPNSIMEVDYDGSKSGVVYIEVYLNGMDFDY